VTLKHASVCIEAILTIVNLDYVFEDYMFLICFSCFLV